MTKKKKKEKVQKYRRPSWDEYFISIVDIVGTRATCDRGRSGAIAVRDNRILVTGYVGSPIGSPHCDDEGHEMHTVRHEDGKESRHCIRTTHAEQNLIAQAARIGIPLEGATIYCRMTPCYTCAKMLINSGVSRIVCVMDYHAGEASRRVFDEAEIIFELLNDALQEYDDM